VEQTGSAKTAPVENGEEIKIKALSARQRWQGATKGRSLQWKLSRFKATVRLGRKRSNELQML
jgi:hypothetical protein